MQEIEHLGLCKFFFIYIFVFISIFPQEYPDQKVHSLMRKGLDFLINEEFDKAEVVFNNLNQAYIELPLGYVGLTAIEILKSYDYGIPYNKKRIESLLDSAEIKSSMLLKKNNKDKWNNYLFALSKGYYAYYRGLTGDYFAAISAGMSSLDHFEKCLKEDPEFTEAFIALGVYKYWKSRKIDFLTWLPFIKDEREIGKEYLKRAIKKNSYSTHLAINSLIWIYNSEGKYKDAIDLAKGALELYPNSRFFKWGMGRALEEFDKNKAINLYKEMLASYSTNNRGSRINEVVLKHKIAQQYTKLGDEKNALILCNEILTINNFSDYEKERLSKRIERVKNLQKELTAKSGKKTP